MDASVCMRDRFRGCLLGLAVGDGLGGRFEAQTPDWIAKRYPSPQSLVDRPPTDLLSYTDDTQMTIGVAETLVAHGRIEEGPLCQAFVGNYVASRGYGFGARRVLEAMEDGSDYKAVAESHYPGGSFGNGAAMRVAPVGLFFKDNLEMVWDQARLSALPTHLHPLGIEGAQLLAVAVALLARQQPFQQAAFLNELQMRCQTVEFRAKIERLSTLHSPEELALLGNGIAALESVATAIGCFLLAPDCYVTTVGRAVLLGGDTDTIACMAGALSGAYLGHRAIPSQWLDILEDHEGFKGRSYLATLADQLFERKTTS